MSFIAFFFTPLGRWLGISAVALSIVGGAYLKGRSDGRASYQAKLTREINKAIATGDRARTEALKKFDSQKDVEDDGFARD